MKSSGYCGKNKIWTGDGQNNGNPGQYSNKTVCAGCTERTLIVSFDILLFVYALYCLCQCIKDCVE